MTDTLQPTLEEVVAEHRPFIRRTLARLGVAGCDVDDVEQEVLRGIDRGLPSFDRSLSPRPATAWRCWIYCICERQAANHRRAARERAEVLSTVEALDVHAEDVPDGEARLLAGERTALLLSLLSRIEPDRRAVVIAYDLEEVPMPQVARDLAIPLNTAWNRLRLARADLRGAWRRLHAARA